MVANDCPPSSESAGAADSEEGGQALKPSWQDSETDPRLQRVVCLISSCAILFFWPGRGNVCSRGTHRRPAVQSSRLFRRFTSWRAHLRINCGVSGGEARTHRRDSTEFRYSESKRRRRASRRKPGDLHDPRASAGGFWKPDRRPDSIGGWPAFAIATTLAITAFLAQRWHLSHSRFRISATMLGLGLGIDYALLMISRFREAISAGTDRGLGSSRHVRQVARS